MRTLAGAALAAFFATSCGSPLPAATPPAPAPLVGQPGKDVVWVPSPERLVDAMLDLAALNSSDYLIDLGSGDGRTVLAAARRGVRALGIEFNPDLVRLSERRAQELGLAWRATFRQGDIFNADFSHATVITLFLSSQINLQLRPRLLELEPGTRIVSNTFTMADWEPDSMTEEGDCASWCEALLWIVPAKAGGTWMIGSETLALEQTFQRVSGTLGAVTLEQGRLRGERISFTVGSRRDQGHVAGGAMKGVRDDGQPWSAARR